MSVDLTALNIKLSALQNQSATLSGLFVSPIATSAAMSSAVANATEVRSAVPAVVAAAGLDSDLLAQRAAVWQAICDVGTDIRSVMQAIAALGGPSWPPNAGANYGSLPGT